MGKNKKVEDTIADIVIFLLGFFFVWITALLFLKADTHYATKKDFSIYNGLSIVSLGVFIAFCSFFKTKGKGQRIAAFCDKHIGIIWIIVFFLQIYIFWNIYFETGWDVRAIISADHSDYYFQCYPNNVFLSWFTQKILQLNDNVGVNFGQYQLMPLIILNCAISSLIGRLVYFIIKNHFSVLYAIVGNIIYFFLVALSPWNVIPYSDAWGLLFPVSIYALYISKAGGILKGTGILILSYIGYQIKPQSAIMLIAIIIVEVCRNDFFKKALLNIRRIIVICAITVLSLLIISQFLEKQYLEAGFIKNKEARLGMCHFFMMGLNEQRNGTYASKDVYFSLDLPTKELRDKENLRVGIERIKEMGVLRLSKHLSKKLLIAFNDGTYAWGKEGTFYSVLTDDANSKISPLLKNIYYTKGEHHFVYGFVIQQMWMMVVLGITVCVPLTRAVVKKRKELLVVYLALLGLILFELLFEVRARYLYTYVPLFIVAFITGLHTLLNRIAKKRVCLKE